MHHCGNNLVPSYDSSFCDKQSLSKHRKSHCGSSRILPKIFVPPERKKNILIFLLFQEFATVSQARRTVMKMLKTFRCRDLKTKGNEMITKWVSLLFYLNHKILPASECSEFSSVILEFIICFQPKALYIKFQ